MTQIVARTEKKEVRAACSGEFRARQELGPITHHGYVPTSPRVLWCRLRNKWKQPEHQTETMAVLIPVSTVCGARS